VHSWLPAQTFPGEVPVYRMGAKHFDMKKFFDANIDKFDIFVYENLNPEDHTWEQDYELCECLAQSQWVCLVNKRRILCGLSTNVGYSLAAQ
jgi:hypothetical protein